MSSFDEAERDVESVRLPRWGQVVPDGGVVPWLVGCIAAAQPRASGGFPTGSGVYATGG